MNIENHSRDAANGALELIASRSSVKKFAEQAPSRAQIETLLAAARPPTLRVAGVMVPEPEAVEGST